MKTPSLPSSFSVLAACSALCAAPLVACGDAGGGGAPASSVESASTTFSWPLEVTPSATDPALTSPAYASYVWGATASRKDLLVVFLPGSLAMPSEYTVINQTIASLGYDVIDLTYDNGAEIASYCPDPLVKGSAQLQQEQDACFEAARGTILFGKGSTYGREPNEPGSWQPPAAYQILQATVGTTMATSVVNRLVAMLEYLGTTGGVAWKQYLMPDAARQYAGAQLPDWSRIVVAGHSQGGGNAAFLAQRFVVHRAVSLSSPSDSWACTTATCAGHCVLQGGIDECAASWITAYAPSTAHASMYALGNTGEGDFGAQTEPNNWALLGLPGPLFDVDGKSPPYSGSHELVTSIPSAACDRPGQTCAPLEEHDTTAVDSALTYVNGVPVLAPVWTTMFTGNGADEARAHAATERFVESAGSAAGCPASAPRSGGACTSAGLSCTYGTDPRFGCRVESTCTGGAWSTSEPSCEQPPPACPAANPGGAGCTEAQDGLTCIYGRTPYVCAPDNGDLYIIKDGKPWRHWWALDALPAGCPAGAVPNLGTSCSASGVACNYGGCINDPASPDAHGVEMSCTGARWTFVNPICIQ